MTNKVIQLHMPCPVCPSSDAYSIYEDGHGHCFSCGYHHVPNHPEEPEELYTYEFLPLRGITKEVFRFYNVKSKVDRSGRPTAIGFPYSKDSTKVRLLDRKEFFWQGESHAAGLFGTAKFASGSHSYVVLTEGELDALSLYQVLRIPVVSVQSASSAARDCVANHAWLSGFDRIYLAFDNDAAGREATKEVARLFDYNKVYVLRFTNRKDANEYLQVGEDDALRNIFANARRYVPETIVSTLSEFKEILRAVPSRGIEYPFRTLNSLTYGIRTGETVLLTAQEGVGKTEIMHAIEHKLLKETDDAVGAIYLEEPKQRHLQALAGLELRLPVHLPDCDCTPDKVVAALEALVGKDERLHVYSHFGSDDPMVLLDTIRFLVSARKCRYILLDHITMAVSGLAGEDERRSLDLLSTRLEMMVKELDYALIIVSHVNDLGQTRGSRYISKIADIRIDATRDTVSPDVDVRNTTYLTVSKNRFSGKTGPAGKLYFDPQTFTITELDDGQVWEADEADEKATPVPSASATEGRGVLLSVQQEMQNAERFKQPHIRATVQ
jgi:twinkle protein